MKTVREWINTVDINMLDESHMNYTPLIIAVTKNNKDLVELLLANGADPNFAVDDTALILASQNGYIDIVRILLDKGADPNRPNGNRITPIISAAYNGHTAVVQALLDAGADPNVVSRSGYTALLFAVENNRIETVRLLLSKGVDVNFKRGRVTPLHIAAKKGYKEIVELLLAAGADKDAEGESRATPLAIATEHNKPEVVKVLLEAGADPNKKNIYQEIPLVSALRTGSPVIAVLLFKAGGGDPNMVIGANSSPILLTAAEWRDETFFDLLLAEGVDVNKTNTQGMTALIIAANNNYISKIEKLLAAGADPNVVSRNGYTALLLAVENNRIEAVRALLSKGVDVNFKRGSSAPLHIAARKGYKEIVELLLAAGADKDAEGESRATPLALATEYNSPEVVKILLAAGADPNKGTISGYPLLMFAFKYKSPDMAKLLFKAGGGDPNMVVGANSSPIILLAAERSDETFIDLLLAAGVDVNKTNTQGVTALILAANINYIPNIKKLLAAGADPNKQTVKDKTFALLYASQSKSPKAIELLLEYGADVNLEDQLGKTALFVSAHTGDVDSVKLILAKNPALTDKINEAIKLRAFKPEILTLLKKKYPQTTTPWKGFTRSDIQKLDTIFGNTEGRNFSYCPVCLKYIERSEACNYMSHNCSMGNYYHEDLYRKYRNSEGIISWCTICGRICVGHSHYQVVAADAPKPAPIILEGANPFERDCRMTSGGGGLPEKLARFKGLRKAALGLQAEIGKMEEEVAMDKLVEASWNAALSASRAQINNMSKPANWNNNTQKFLPNVATIAPTGNANDPTKYSAPMVLSPGVGAAGEGRNANYQGNYITGEDDVPVIVFKHKDKEGRDHVHPQIGKEMLLDFLDGAGDRLGKCFDDSCGGLLYPREIELAFADPKIVPTITDEDRERLAKYKERFNRWHAKGGRRRTKRTKHARSPQRKTRRSNNRRATTRRQTRHKSHK